MDLLLIIFLTLLNALFAMSELAIASSKKARLAAMQEGGSAGAGAALELMEQPTQFLSTVQVGITSIGMLNGIVGEAAFSGPLAIILERFGLSPYISSIAATAIVVIAITFTTIIFGELVPKRIGQMFPEQVSVKIAKPMTWLAIATKPFVKLLSLCTQTVLKILKINETNSQSVTQEEISANLEEGVNTGLIEKHEHQLLRNVFHLDDRPLTSLMLPRTDIEWLDANLTIGGAINYISEKDEKTAHSWYPVCRDNLEDIVGIISVQRLLTLKTKSSETIEKYMDKATFVPETLSALEMLEQLQDKSGRILFVVDEYGIVQGLVTPHDLLEAITGELKPDLNTTSWATKQADHTWELNGLMPISELKSKLNINQLPQENKGRYNTLAGLLLSQTGQIPIKGEEIECAGWIFQINTLEGKRIDKVKAKAVI